MTFTSSSFQHRYLYISKLTLATFSWSNRRKKKVTSGTMSATATRTGGGSPKNPLLLRRLYRSLLRTVRPFSPSSPPNFASSGGISSGGDDDSFSNSTILYCLLHRTGLYDTEEDSDDSNSMFDGNRVGGNHIPNPPEQARDLTQSYSASNHHTRGQPYQYQSNSIQQSSEALFRKLLREAVSGSPKGSAHMLFPSQIIRGNVDDDNDNNKFNLLKILRREFRNDPGSLHNFDLSTRIQASFLALRALNQKLLWHEQLQRTAPKVLPNQAAATVTPLDWSNPDSYLRPGVFLLSHPHMRGSIFTHSVILILDHVPDQYTYGLIVNRPSRQYSTGKMRALKEVFVEQQFPEPLAEVFGEAPVYEGGPIHASIQMIYSKPAEADTTDSIGGRLIPTITTGDQSPALYSDKANYYQGNVMKAIEAIQKGDIDKNDIRFFVGASTWSPSQLQSEVERGFWMPVAGDVDMARTGCCKHVNARESDDTVNSLTKKPLPDLWLSMMSAVGPEEAKLAHLLYHQDMLDDALEEDEDEEDIGRHGLPCDALN